MVAVRLPPDQEGSEVKPHYILRVTRSGYFTLLRCRHYDRQAVSWTGTNSGALIRAAHLDAFKLSLSDGALRVPTCFKLSP